jgi:hypothetical protein
MLTVPRINADDVTLSRGLFLTCRGAKYIQYYRTLLNVQYLQAGSLTARKYLTWGGFSARCEPLLHSGPMLKIDCLFPTSHQPHPFLKPAFFNLTYPHM